MLNFILNSISRLKDKIFGPRPGSTVTIRHAQYILVRKTIWYPAKFKTRKLVIYEVIDSKDNKGRRLNSFDDVNTYKVIGVFDRKYLA